MYKKDWIWYNKHVKYPDLSLILACYNEGPLFYKNVKEIERILALSTLTYELIFVDDGSHDATRTIIKKLVLNRKNASYIFHDTNTGRGGAIRDGIYKAKGRVVGYIDVDLEVSPVYIPLCVEEILHGHDVCIGTRIYRETITSFHRHILSRGYVLLVKWLLNVPLEDTEQGYKFFNRMHILPILKETLNDRWFFDTEILARAYYANFKIKEQPVLFIRNSEKRSTVRIIPDTIDYVTNLIQFRNRIKKEIDTVAIRRQRYRTD